jgi:SPP1 gp7 family putative phage head morphogenesis protein
MAISVNKLRIQLAKQRRKGLKGIRFSPILALKYERLLLQLVRKLEKSALDYIDSIRASGYIHDSPSYPRFNLSEQMKNLDSWAEETSKKFAANIETFHRNEWRNELNSKMGIDVKSIFKTETVKPAIDKAVKDNVDLIKSIPKEYHDKIIDAIDNGMINGDDSKTLKSMVKEIGDTTDYRARLIARDQTSKLLGALNEVRQKEAGIDSYIWSTCHDDRVRETHAANDGKRFRWDSPPEETGHPGEDVQCRCVADPDLSSLMEMINNEE